MKITVFQIKDRLTPDEVRLAEVAAKAAGLTLDQWLERALKAAIYAPVIGSLNPPRAVA
jgi:predicted HicB family RNase H-like nuclease